MILAFRLARRKLRGGVRGLRIVLACLALGVAVIAGVGTLRAAVDRGLEADGRRILGGDLEIESGSQPLPDALRSWLGERGAQTSDVVRMRSMLVAPSGERQLIELKAVDLTWPLVGDARFTPAQDVAEALAERGGSFGLIADPLALERLNLRAGDPVRVGTQTFTLRGALAGEPDRIGAGTALAPHALIALDALPGTGLIEPGSIMRYAIRVLLPADADPAATAAAIRRAFPDQGWRIRDASNAAPGVARFIDRTSLFLTLVGLTSLLVGGIGVASGVRSWLEARARTIATLRCLGASAALVFGVCLIQVMALATVGVAAGLVVGAALPALAVAALGDVLPVPPRLGLYPGPLALAAAFGLLTAASFAIWPLGRAARIPGAALFRDALLPDRAWPSPRLAATGLALTAALATLLVLTAPDRGFALWFCAAAAGTLALFRLGGAALVALSRRMPRPGMPAIRLGIANLHRPGAATAGILVSIGLGLSTLAAVALIQGNLRRQVIEQLPANAPSFFFVDIQNDQMPRFEAIVDGLAGVSDLRHVPSLRARIVTIGGVPVEQVQATEETRWALRGDRGLTYAATPPEGTRLVAGSWWSADYRGPPLLSLDADLAQGWGVGLGSAITLNVLGREIEFRVASLRDIAWRSLALNFTLVASPGLLERAPHTNIATVRATPAAQGPLLRSVTDALPNVTGILVADVLRAVAGILAQLTAALAATGSLTLLVGALVLAGAVAAGQRRRVHEAVILKTLGATRRQVRTAWLVEFGALGIVAGLIAAAVGTAASYGVVRLVMRTDWVFLPATLAATVIACILMMLGAGYAATAMALRVKPGPLLRNE